MNCRDLFHKRLLRICGAMSMVLTSACNSHPPVVPVEMPFGLGQGGESVEFEFRVKEAWGHVVRLKFFYRNQEESNDRRASAALIEQLGSGFAADGSLPFVRVPITLRIRVKSIDVNGPSVDFDHTTDQIGFLNASKEFANKQVQMLINNQKLQPGTYHIRVDNLHPVPEFADRSIHIVVLQAWQGK